MVLTERAAVYQVTAQLVYDIVRSLQTCAGTPNPNTPMDAFELGPTRLSVAAYGKVHPRVHAFPAAPLCAVRPCAACAMHRVQRFP